MKKIIVFVLIAISIFALVSCGSENVSISVPDAVYETAIIDLLNGETVTVEVRTFSTVAYCERVYIECQDGTTYITDMKNVVLIGRSTE